MWLGGGVSPGIHQQHINITRFANHSPHIFATSSFDKCVKMWDVRTSCLAPTYECKCVASLGAVGLSWQCGAGAGILWHAPTTCRAAGRLLGCEVGSVQQGCLVSAGRRRPPSCVPSTCPPPPVLLLLIGPSALSVGLTTHVHLKSPVLDPNVFSRSDGSIVMICFSPDDTFLLSSAVDNELRQYTAVDGR